MTRLVVAGAFALAMTAQTSMLFAADDIQQIKLGPRTLYIPKSWMQGGAVTAYAPPQTMVQQPQPDPIIATSLSIRPREDWKPYGRHELPELIRVGYGPRTAPLPPPLATLQQQLLDKASSMKLDADGFVRTMADPTNPTKQLALETFVYRDLPERN
jgi:hypothetical protein